MTFSHLAIQITVICIIKEGQFRRGMFKQVHAILYHSRMHAVVKTDMRKNCVVCVYTQSQANLMVLCKSDFLQPSSSDFSDWVIVSNVQNVSKDGERIKCEAINFMHIVSFSRTVHPIRGQSFIWTILFVYFQSEFIVFGHLYTCAAFDFLCKSCLFYCVIFFLVMRFYFILFYGH